MAFLCLIIVYMIICLIIAHNQCERVIPIFIFTPEQVSERNSFRSTKSIQFMIESLMNLSNDIETKKGKLQCFYGEPEKIIGSIMKYLGANDTCIFLNADYTPYSKKRDLKIIKAVGKDNVKFCHDYALYQPGTILNKSGEPFQKFTPFYNVCLNVTVRKPTEIKTWNFLSLDTNVLKLENITLARAMNKFVGTNNGPSFFTGGRDAGILKMKAGLKLINYDNLRNDLNTPTTQMSPYLKYGCISVREFFHKIKDKMGLDSALLRQLIWRDFYLHLMYCFPRVLNGKSLKPKYDNIVWENNNRLFNAWKRGKTGYPIIDANMRMLNETGYMHNRGRLIVSSFLVKLCLVDWRKGEKYFATKLIDYDPASNNGNWQWIVVQVRITTIFQDF